VQKGLQSFAKDWFEQSVGVRLTMLGVRGTEVYLGDGPITDGPPHGRLDGNREGCVPMVLARRHAVASTFVAVHEPYDKQPRVKRVKRIDESNEAVGLAVDAETFTDRV